MFSCIHLIIMITAAGVQSTKKNSKVLKSEVQIITF